jgi:hypothetical protein
VLAKESILQYEIEERSLLAKRATSEHDRLKHLIRCMKKDEISTPEKIKQLRSGLFKLTHDVKIKKAKNMGQLLNAALNFIIRNYKSENPYIIK